MSILRWAAAGLLLLPLLPPGLAFAASPSLETAEARYQPVAREQIVDGVIEAVNRSTVSAQTSGQVVEINFDVDDFVTKGSVLVRLRDKAQQAALAAAEARYKEANANFRRTSDIYARKLVAKSALDKAEADLKSSKAALDQAREELDHTVIRAPYSGIVVARQVELGETANPGQPLMTGLSLEKLRAVADVPQRYVDTVRHLSHARVILTEGERKVLESTRLTVSPYADPQSHTFRVRVELPDGQHGVYPGMYAKVAFTTGEQQQLLVPAAAVVHRSEVTAVYVVEKGGAVAFREIRLGRALDNGMVEVLAGLDAGEQVALDPVKAGIYLKGQRAGSGS